jgi:hypothetical protein
MPLAKEMPPLEFLNECFELRDEGLLFWKVRPREHFQSDSSWKSFNTSFSNTEAGSTPSSGYRQVRIGPYRLVKSHRIIYSIYYETALDTTLSIDHINGIKTDNRPENLRLVSDLENKRNARMYTNNTSGVNGACWHKRLCKWVVTIKLEDKRLPLGVFDNIEEAAAARKAADIKYGFSERHGEPL